MITRESPVSEKKAALLVLADGSVFRGTAIGADGLSVGEVVFNTAMTGYQEILTDPSYAQQIVTLTYPHIGNTGTNSEDEECGRIWASGLVIRDLPLIASNFRNEQDLSSYLRARNILGIADIDTRRLTRILRDKGAQNGCIMVGAEFMGQDGKLDEAKALAAAKAFGGLKGLDLAKEVTVSKAYSWNEGTWQLKPPPSLPLRKGEELSPPPGKGRAGVGSKFKVVAYDYGVKRNILRMLADRDCELIVVPAKTPASEVLAMKPDGVFLSNGPGDPEPCTYAIEAIKTILETNIPVFGICLGHQLLALASGAKTIKMKFGHHGGNHPVQDLDSKRVMITAQNHGFAVEETSLPANLRTTHKSLFDGSLQGIHRTDKPAFSFQGHPEASPGPHEAAELFDHFIELMTAHKKS